MSFIPPFTLVAVSENGKETLVPNRYPTRYTAERAASEASRRDLFSLWYEVRARNVDRSERYGGKLDKTWWVTIYKDGWLKDANMRGSYEPSDQRASQATNRRVPRFAQGAARANDSPTRSQSATPSQLAELRQIIREQSVLGKTHSRETLARKGFLRRRFVLGQVDYVPTVEAALALGIDPTTCSGTGEGAATRALSRSGSPKRFKIIGLTIGHTAVTMHRIPASPHDIPSGSVVTVEEILKLPGRRSKDAFGTWTTSGKAVRVRFGYRGASYWADEGSLEPTGAPGLSSPKRASRAAHRAPGNALGHLLHEGASKVAKLFTSKKGRAR